MCYALIKGNEYNPSKFVIYCQICIQIYEYCFCIFLIKLAWLHLGLSFRVLTRAIAWFVNFRIRYKNIGENERKQKTILIRNKLLQ